MPELSIATFNCENMFRRFKFDENLSKAKVDDAVENGFIINNRLFDTVQQPEQKLTAHVIKDTGADIVALQEVENLDTLKNFCTQYNLASKYPYKLLIDGNDPRLIDVAVLSKYPFDRIVTHQYVKNSANRYLFSRDCLEVEFKIEGKPFYLFINHLKSMFDRADPENGRKNTAQRRIEQVDGIMKIIRQRLENKLTKADYAIVGDFNDYPAGDTSLAEFFKTFWLHNIVDNLPVDERWTHFWDNSKLTEPEKYRQLDYIWLSHHIVKKNPKLMPEINRKGLTKKAIHPAIPKRYSEIEESTKRIAASDHCSVTVKFEI